MAVAPVLVFAAHNRLRYLITDDGDHANSTITTTGGATPDILTDTTNLQGVIRKAAKAFTDGYGQIPAGALSQATARQIWLADNTAGTSPGNANIQRVQCHLTRRDVPASDISVDANVDGGGHPTIVVAFNSGGGAAHAYLDIEALGAIGA